MLGQKPTKEDINEMLADVGVESERKICKLNKQHSIGEVLRNGIRTEKAL